MGLEGSYEETLKGGGKRPDEHNGTREDSEQRDGVDDGCPLALCCAHPPDVPVRMNCGMVPGRRVLHGSSLRAHRRPANGRMAAQGATTGSSLRPSTPQV